MCPVGHDVMRLVNCWHVTCRKPRCQNTAPTIIHGLKLRPVLDLYLTLHPIISDPTLLAFEATQHISSENLSFAWRMPGWHATSCNSFVLCFLQNDRRELFGPNACRLGAHHKRQSAG